MDDRGKDLVAENIDAAFRWGVLPDATLVARASPAYLARKGVPGTPTDLLKHDGINYSYRKEE